MQPGVPTCLTHILSAIGPCDAGSSPDMLLSSSSHHVVSSAGSMVAKPPLLPCRPFGSRVAETLLKRLEVLIADAPDEPSSEALQQVAMSDVILHMLK